MKFKIEIVVNIIFLLKVLIDDMLNVVGAGIMGISLMMILLFFHLFGGWYFYRNDNQKNKFSFSIPLGIALAFFDLAIMFKIMTWQSYNILLIVSLVSIVILGIFNWVKNKKETPIYFNMVSYKLVSVLLFGVIFYMINLVN